MLVYIHIPYCDSKCHYCSFNSYVDMFDTRTAYMQALRKQLRFELTRFGAQHGSIETLYIGGGTPSTVSPEHYRAILKLLKPYLQINAEITVEANPNSATENWLKGMRGLGVNRVSFGVQSFDANKLQKLNRAHSPQQAIDAIMAAKNIGFEHISLDIIYGYEGDTNELLLDDIQRAFALPIDHISAYELTIEDGTKFSTTPTVALGDDDLAFFVANEIKKRDFTHYEISNFGSYQSRHNRGYWELKNYIGAGAGAVGFLHDTRYYPQTDIEMYIKDPLYITEEALTSDELATERIFLGLRSSVGIEKSLLSQSMLQKADILYENNKLTCDTTHYYNTNFFLSDELALFLLS